MLTARPEIKICGLTDPDQAERCVDAGADAIGVVFYPRSPRNVTTATAKAISAAVRKRTTVVGVFVDAPFDAVMTLASGCGLDAVQLHGQESPELVARLMKENLTVIKALFASRMPQMTAAPSYRPAAYLVECGKGRLPGGNARTWDWQAAACVKPYGPLLLAGGLDPDNVRQAVAAVRPDGVDVSSGVEAAAGRKDMTKVIDFINAVGDSTVAAPDRRIFTHD